MMPTLDLTALAGTEVAVLIGQDRGLAVREALRIDEMDKIDEPISVTIPPHLRTLTPSFVQGLFAKSVHELGEAGFFAHYQFNAPEHLLSDIQTGVNRALTNRHLAGG